LSIWPDNRACPGHNTESIAIAIKSKANLCIARLNRDLVAILKTPEVSRVFIEQGIEPAPSSPEAFGRFIRAEFEKWGRVLRDAKVVAQ
jgi:tripartite-type tricarboxylate transporter receptor subunit TctC